MRLLGCWGLSKLERERWLAGLGVLVAAIAAGPSAASPMFVPLGDLPGGLVYSYAAAVSADGSTVVGRSGGASGEEAFRWTSGGGMVGLGDLAGGASSATPTPSRPTARRSPGTATARREPRPSAGPPAAAWWASATCPVRS
jgi:probable HAF family extracellular repeat protein